MEKPPNPRPQPELQLCSRGWAHQQVVFTARRSPKGLPLCEACGGRDG